EGNREENAEREDCAEDVADFDGVGEEEGQQEAEEGQRGKDEDEDHLCVWEMELFVAKLAHAAEDEQSGEDDEADGGEVLDAEACVGVVQEERTVGLGDGVVADVSGVVVVL